MGTRDGLVRINRRQISIGSIVSSARHNHGEGSELVKEAASFGRLDTKIILKKGRLQGAGVSMEAVCPTLNLGRGGGFPLDLDILLYPFINLYLEV